MSETGRDEKLTNQQVYSSTAAIMEALNREFGTPKIQIVERVMRWLSTQPKAIRQEFMTEGGDPTGEMVRLRLAELAASGQQSLSPLSFEDAMKLIRTTLERLENIDLARRREIENLQKRKR